MTYTDVARRFMTKTADGWGYKPQPVQQAKPAQPQKPAAIQPSTMPKPPAQPGAMPTPQVPTQAPKPVAQNPQTQTAATQPAPKTYTQVQQNRASQPPSQRVYQPGDWTRNMANAPLAFQVFNPELYTNADVWNDVGNGVRAGVRGAVKGLHSAVSFGMRIPSYLHRAWETVGNADRPEYKGMGWKQRWDATKTQTQNSWTASLGRQADRYDDLVEEGMNAVPGMSYTNDFETNYPLAKSLGEWGGGVLGGIATGKALGTVANPANAPQSVQPMLNKLPGAVQGTAKVLGHTAGDFLGYAADTLKSAKDMPQWGANVIDAGTNAYGLYNAVAGN